MNHGKHRRMSDAAITKVRRELDRPLTIHPDDREREVGEILKGFWKLVAILVVLAFPAVVAFLGHAFGVWRVIGGWL